MTVILMYKLSAVFVQGSGWGHGGTGGLEGIRGLTLQKWLICKHKKLLVGEIVHNFDECVYTMFCDHEVLLFARELISM